jgi:hypothetical protein
MLDFDLAEMYGVETKRLKEQVRRNIERFLRIHVRANKRRSWQFSRSQIATLKTGQDITSNIFRLHLLNMV